MGSSWNCKPASKFTLYGDIGYRYHILLPRVRGLFFLVLFLGCHMKGSLMNIKDNTFIYIYIYIYIYIKFSLMCLLRKLYLLIKVMILDIIKGRKRIHVNDQDHDMWPIVIIPTRPVHKSTRHRLCPLIYHPLNPKIQITYT